MDRGRLLKVNLLHYWADRGVPPHAFPYMDVREPAIRWTAFAEAFGAKGWEVADVANLASALSSAWATPGVDVIDARVDGSVTEEIAGVVRAVHGGA